MLGLYGAGDTGRVLAAVQMHRVSTALLLVGAVIGWWIAYEMDRVRDREQVVRGAAADFAPAGGGDRDARSLGGGASQPLTTFVEVLPRQVRSDALLVLLQKSAKREGVRLVAVLSAGTAGSASELARVTVQVRLRGSYGAVKRVLGEVSRAFEGELVMPRVVMRQAAGADGGLATGPSVGVAAVGAVGVGPLGAGERPIAAASAGVPSPGLDVQVEWVLLGQPLTPDAAASRREPAGEPVRR